MKEIWKDIKGYEELYQVSNFGRIKRISYLHGKSKKYIKKEKIKKAVITIQGYLQVGLSNNGLKHIKVHRLVAETFIPNPNNLPQINHKDGNKQNNNVDNLEWCTCSENIIHAFKNNLKKGKRDEENILSKKVIQYNLNGEKIKEWDSTMQIQRELGINNVSISQCCLNKIKKSHNFIWKYKNE